MENKSYNYILNEILSKVLELSENPSQFTEYLTHQIRELVGARTIVIAIKDETSQTKIFSVFPVRKTNWANQSAVLNLAERTFDYKSVQFLEKEASDEIIRNILEGLEIDQAIAIPLIAANRLVGSILLLDIMDSFGMDSVITLLSQLSGVFALVIRNANLYQNMDDLVEIRTEELLKRNDELIAERIRAEKSELQAREILQTAMDGFWTVDIEGRFIDVNHVACKMLGYSAEEMLTMRISDIEINETAEQTKAHISKIKKNGEDRFESKHRCNDGRIIDVEVSTTLQPAQNLMVAFISDITERKKAEMQLKEKSEKIEDQNEQLMATNTELILAKEKAEESDRLKSAFLANMSHEIRTPMNGILGFADLLNEPGLTGEEQQEYLGIIAKSGARMLNIINDIIDISKIESGQMKVSVSETNVKEQLDFVYRFFEPEVEQKGLKLTLKKSLTSAAANIQTDREKLYAILTNLIKNAIKYTPEGSIEFGYYVVESRLIPSLQFYVKDTGIGIPNDRQNAIFERFIQADIMDKMARQGAGLGLAISKAYVEMLGGKIWVESEEGKGSTFYFTLPFAAETKEKESPKKEISSPIDVDQFKKLKILIAEDDESSSKLISLFVQKITNEIILVKTGMEVVDACRSHPDIDLILMDIQMPEMNGYEATRQIRQFNTKVFIIAQSAFALTGDHEKAIEAGCNDYISKPIDKDKLLQLIQKYFRK